MTDTATLRSADRNARLAALTLAFCLPSDVLLYLLLPMHPEAFGITLAEAGILLAANRLVRIFGYRQVLHFYSRFGDRRTLTLAALAAMCCAVGNSTLSGFAALLGLRLVWGLCFAALNLSTQVLATAQAEGAAKRSGRSRAFIAIGPMLALPLGALLSEACGPLGVHGAHLQLPGGRSDRQAPAHGPACTGRWPAQAAPARQRGVVVLH